MPLVPKGVRVRLLADRFISKLVPAVELFVKESGVAVEIRSNEVHDRFLFVDGKECYQSGSSFKDGARYTPTIVNQIVDAFDAVSKTYEAKWTSGKVRR